MVSVNMVNAAAVASSNGIAVSTIRHDRQCDYETLLRVTINHDGRERTIAGTLVGGNKPRIIEVQSIAVESDFPKNLLYLRNYDKPGFIGDLGTLCGRHGLNIATFHLGRRDVGGEAIALVEIDDALPVGVLDEIRCHKWCAPIVCSFSPRIDGAPALLLSLASGIKTLCTRHEMKLWLLKRRGRDASQKDSGDPHIIKVT